MTTAPAELVYGFVTGRLILIIGDSNDAGRMPDPVPATGTTVLIAPKQPLIRVAGADPTTVVKQSITCTLDEDGRLLDPSGAWGVWLVAGVYTVTYKSSTAMIPTHDIEVTAAHTEESPLDLTLAMPPGGPVLTPSQYAELSARIDGLTFEAAGVSSVNGATGTVVLDADDVGALPSTYTPPAQSWSQITGKPTTFAPTTHAASHATGGSDPIAPESIGAPDNSQVSGSYYNLSGTSTPFGPGQTQSIAMAVNTVSAGLGVLNMYLSGKANNTHEHSYADITDPPTIPDPQTLSLSGSDLTLSDGGGTVTLPSGGGGGAIAEQPLPGVGKWVTGSSITSVSQYTPPAGGTVWPMVMPLPWGLTFDQTAVRVMTEEAGAEGKVLVYSVAGKESDATLVWTSPTISLAVAGDAIATTPAVTLPPGQYWVAFVHTMTTGKIRTYEWQGTFQSIGHSFNEASVVPKTGFRISVGTFESPAANATGVGFYTGSGQLTAAVGFRRSA